MIRETLKRYWPNWRLRTWLLVSFLVAAGLPGAGAVLLRVYENTLVRQTEAELIAQGATIVAAAGGRFTVAKRPEPERGPQSRIPNTAEYSAGPVAGAFWRPESPTIDLSTSPILRERPAPIASDVPPDRLAQSRADQLVPVIEQTQRTTLASIILVDRNGTVLNGVWVGKSYAHVPEVKAALTGKTGTVLRRNGNYRPRYTFEWISRAAMLRVHHVRPIRINGRIEGAVILSRSSRALFRGLYQDRGKIALGVAAIFVLLVGLTLLLHRSIAKPIEALSVATRDVAAGRGEVPETPATAATEIRALYDDFRDMAGVITRRSRYLRDFAAAVSHEFKTPLAGIRGAIELIEDHHGSMSAKERKQFLGNISADAERLSALVGRLLDLARADMAKPELGASADLGAILPRVADAVRDVAFAVRMPVPGSLSTVAVPPHALESVLLSLLENAKQAGASAVTISAERSGSRMTLGIADNGPGIAEADRERLFEPFFTTRRAEGGTGLGLPIARSLIEASNGSLELANSESGALFRLKLPLSARSGA